jgi:hypothetical protein
MVSVSLTRGHAPLKAAVQGLVNYSIPASVFERLVVVSSKHSRKHVEVALVGYGHAWKHVGLYEATM